MSSKTEAAPIHRGGPAIALRPLVDADLPSLAGWLPATVALVGAERLASGERLVRPGRTLAIEHEGEVIGLALAAAGKPTTDAATVELLALRPESSRAGLGLRAALALEERLRAAGARRVYAAVTSRHGLSVY